MSAKAFLQISSIDSDGERRILQQVVAVGDIGHVMLVVVELEGFLRHVGAERVIGIGQGGEFKGHVRSSLKWTSYLVARA